MSAVMSDRQIVIFLKRTRKQLDVRRSKRRTKSLRLKKRFSTRSKTRSDS